MPPKKKQEFEPRKLKWDNEECLNLNKKTSKELKEKIDTGKAKKIYIFIMKSPNILGKKYLIEDKNIVREKIYNAIGSITRLINNYKPSFSGNEQEFHKKL